MKNLLKNFLIFILVFLVIAGLFSLYQNPTRKTEEISLDQFVGYVEKEEVKKIEVEGAKLIITLNNDEVKQTYKEPEESLSELLKNYGVSAELSKKIPTEIKGEGGASYWLSTLLPFLIPFFLIGLLIYFMIRSVQGVNKRAMMFGQSSVRRSQSQDKKNKVTFEDVAGAREAKEELMEVVEFLKNPKKFTMLGAKIPKGVLLLGPPGTGKTLLARAVASEAKVPFYHISGSEFVEMFVGVGASRVRSAFQQAKKTAPSILFVDELDAVGRQRGAGLGGSHDEREQTLNQILVEMDGFDINSGLVVMAATNRPDVLDPALLRPGRFDRRVVLDLPDIKEREGILKIHSRGKPLAPNIELRRVAERTPGFSGADLENVLNEAAILAARHNQKRIEEKELMDAIEKVLLGPERKSHILSKREKKIAAYHEAGHALVAHESPQADPVHKVSIVARGRAAGYTLKLPKEDRRLHAKSEITDNLAVMLGGYAAEKNVFGEVTTGAGDDLKKATEIARSLVTMYGMSEKLGPRTFGEHEELIFLGKSISEQRNYSEKMAEQIDKEVGAFINQALAAASRIIKNKKKMLDKIANTLLEKETIEKEEFEKLFK